MKLVPEGAPTHIIFTGEVPVDIPPPPPGMPPLDEIAVDPAKLNSSGNPITAGHKYEDFDVVVGKISLNYNPNNPLEPGEFIQYYNSAKGFNPTNTHAEIIPPFILIVPMLTAHVRLAIACQAIRTAAVRMQQIGICKRTPEMPVAASSSWEIFCTSP